MKRFDNILNSREGISRHPGRRGSTAAISFLRGTALWLWLLLLAGAGCRSGEEKGNSAENTAPDEDLLTLSAEQVKANDLLLGHPENYAFKAVVEASGHLEALPRNKASVHAITGGVIRGLDLLPGERVTRGETLFRIENQELLQFQEDYLTAGALLEFQKDEVERQKVLAGENVTARKTFLKAESEYLSTRARFSSLEARLAMLHINKTSLLEGRMVTSVPSVAPISGYVTRVEGSNGTHVAPETPVLEIVETSPLMISLQVFEKDIPGVHEGQQVRFTIPDVSAEIQEGTVTKTGKSLDEKRTVNVHVLFTPKSPSPFLPGMFVKAQIITGTLTAMALPLAALVSGEEGEYVLVLSNPGQEPWHLKKVKVTTGMRDSNMAEIKESALLTPGDQVVISGAFSMPR